MHLAGFALFQGDDALHACPAISRIPPSHHGLHDPVRNQPLNLAVPSSSNKQRFNCVETPSELPVGSWLEAGRLFEDIQESSCAIHAIALRIAYLF
jgi:hypothetical protein